MGSDANQNLFYIDLCIGQTIFVLMLRSHAGENDVVACPELSLHALSESTEQETESKIFDLPCLTFHAHI